MALTTNTKRILQVGLANKTAGTEIATAIDANTAKVAAVVAAIATADATDEASAVTLANATKAKVNAILVALKAAGLMASS